MIAFDKKTRDSLGDIGRNHYTEAPRDLGCGVDQEAQNIDFSNRCPPWFAADSAVPEAHTPPPLALSRPAVSRFGSLDWIISFLYHVKHGKELPLC
jgi:hypothetical protein